MGGNYSPSELVMFSRVSQNVPTHQSCMQREWTIQADNPSQQDRIINSLEPITSCAIDQDCEDYGTFGLVCKGGVCVDPDPVDCEWKWEDWPDKCNEDGQKVIGWYYITPPEFGGFCDAPNNPDKRQYMDCTIQDPGDNGGMQPSPCPFPPPPPPPLPLPDQGLDLEDMNKTYAVSQEGGYGHMACTFHWTFALNDQAQPDLTGFLNLSRSVPPGPFSNQEVLNQNVVFACEVVFPTSVIEDVMLLNHGAGGRGTWVGLVASNPPKLVARAGDGSDPSGPGTARLETNVIPLDGHVHAVVMDIRVAGPGRIRVFLEGALVGQGVSSDDQLHSRQFSGGSNPAYGEGGSTPDGKTSRARPGVA